MGRPKLLINLSILKTSTPKLTKICALWVYGKKVRLTANPAQFPTTTGTFLMALPTAIRSRTTCAEVFSVRTISRRGITWAGLFSFRYEIFLVQQIKHQLQSFCAYLKMKYLMCKNKIERRHQRGVSLGAKGNFFCIIWIIVNISEAHKQDSINVFFKKKLSSIANTTIRQMTKLVLCDPRVRYDLLLPIK